MNQPCDSPIEENACTKCGIVKPYTREFFKYQGGYLLRKCRDCGNDEHKEWCLQNKDRLSALRKKRYRRLKDEIISDRKAYYKKNRKEIIAQKLEYMRLNRERINAASRKRHAESPKRRIEASIRSLMSRSIKDKKQRPWESLVGYSVEILMDHIGKQFSPGMEWKNYGEWQIDHIIPRRHFKYEKSTDDQFKRCWALSNLRPLWRIENIRRNYA